MSANPNKTNSEDPKKKESAKKAKIDESLLAKKTMRSDPKDIPPPK